jgi:uncharacterized phage protein (TIGR01671 family)
LVKINEMKNREIKFRAWDKMEEMVYIDDFYWFEEEGVHDSNGEGHYCHYELMQYTGLKDKNGKEIYEGDIIGNTKYSEMYPKQIVFYNGSFGFWDKEDSIPEFFMLYRYLSSREVIGNIYENPELLK